MPDEWLDQSAVVGSPEEWAAAMSWLDEAGIDAVVLVPYIDQLGKDLNGIECGLSTLLGRT